MNCYQHPDTPATAFCRTCGRPLCQLCQRFSEGTVFCLEHAPATYANPDPYSAAASGPYTANVPPTAPVNTSPGLAFLLGLIPGVGAIYNGQYLKGLVHALFFGVLVSLTSTADNTASQPVLGILTAAFFFYMPFEAYHTARKRQLGELVEEWSSLVPQGRFGGRAPVGPFILIILGVFFLLDSLHVLRFREIGRFWPVILIVYGVGTLYSRMGPAPRIPPPAPPPPPPHVPPPGNFANEARTDVSGGNRT
jgi:Domain of unknown function (DUF5668)/B-box zinc finger